MKPDWQRQPDNPVSSCESCQKTLQSCACLGIWFLAALAPMLSIIQFGKHACADRFTYWPSAAVAVGLALTLQFGVRRLDAAFSRRVTPLMLGVAAILCLCYGSVARQTTQYWRNTVTMWERACAVTHNNAFAHAVLGMTYAVEPARLGEAVRQLEISIQLLPNSENIGSLALLLATRAPDAQLDRAVALAHQALDISAAEGTAQVALGLVALRRKDWPEAERLLAAGAAARSDNPMTWEWLGMARYNLKDYAGASDAFRKSLHLSPGNTSLAERIRQAEKLNQEK